MGEQLVETDNLSKTYGAIAAVDRVSLSVWRGEVYGFLGPNGAGKTTTLRMLAGLVTPTGGSASVLGDRPGSPPAQAGTGGLIEADVAPNIRRVTPQADVARNLLSADTGAPATQRARSACPVSRRTISRPTT